MNPSFSRPPLVTISTQTEDTENTEIGLDPIRTELHLPITLLSSSLETMPDYRKHLDKVFREEFFAEATKQDRSLTPILKPERQKVWESLKKTSKYFYTLRKDLAVSESGCMLYDNKLLISRNIKQLVIDAIHQTIPAKQAF